MDERFTLHYVSFEPGSSRVLQTLGLPGFSRERLAEMVRSLTLSDNECVIITRLPVAPVVPKAEA